MKRDDFVFSVGFQGESAIVDKHARRSYAGLSTRELSEKGFFRAAFCSALYSGEEQDAQDVLEAYNKKSKIKLQSPEDMKRLLGVFEVPEHITKVISV